MISSLFKNIRILLIVFITSALLACSSHLATHAHLEQGKRYIETGYYKRAMQQLLGPACDGNPEAQYAVGYMYYYGYGVAQDTEVGYFWIKRAASHGYAPALEALRLIEQDKKYSARTMYK